MNPMVAARVEGSVAAGWEPVAAAFATGFAEGSETGAGLCVVAGGRRVVEVWAGTRDPVAGLPWERDTLVPLTSVTKAVLATIAHVLVAAGELDLDRPVAACWPEFARAGKGGVTARMLLAHQAGLPAFPRPVTFADQLARTPAIEMLAGLAPAWRPGRAHGYHAITFGFLVTEVLRRVTGGTERPLLAGLVAGPLGIDAHLGVPEADLGRVARMVEAGEAGPDAGAAPEEPEAEDYRRALDDEASLTHRATFGSLAMSFEDVNDPRYLTLERPSGGYATATAVATMLAALLGPVEGRDPLVDRRTAAQAGAVAAEGLDRVFRMRTAWGLGYLRSGSPLWRGAGPAAFGHVGSSGALAFADPDRDLALAYLPNRVKSVFACGDRRAHRVMAAAYGCLERR